MAKRKDHIEEEDEFSEDEIEEPKPVKKAKAKSKGKDARKKKKITSESNTEEEEAGPVAKKPKFQKDEAPSDESALTIKTNAEGEKYIDLGKKKRVTVRSFKGVPLIDIREFYGADGGEKPGKKGISLQPDQWDALKNSIDTVDGLFASLKKK